MAKKKAVKKVARRALPKKAAKKLADRAMPKRKAKKAAPKRPAAGKRKAAKKKGAARMSTMGVGAGGATMDQAQCEAMGGDWKWCEEFQRMCCVARS